MPSRIHKRGLLQLLVRLYETETFLVVMGFPQAFEPVFDYLCYALHSSRTASLAVAPASNPVLSLIPPPWPNFLYVVQ